MTNEIKQELISELKKLYEINCAESKRLIEWKLEWFENNEQRSEEHERNVIASLKRLLQA